MALAGAYKLFDQENDVVKKIEEEKDTATCKLSAAENFLKTI